MARKVVVQNRNQRVRPVTALAHSLGMTRKQLARSSVPVMSKVQRRSQRNRTIGTKGFLGDVGRFIGGKIPGVGGIAGPIAGAIGDLLPFSNAPTSKALTIRSMNVNSSAERGREFLATIDVAAGTPAGTLLLDQLIAPPELGKRMPKFAELWTRTRFKVLNVIVSPQTSTSVSGGYVLAIDPDPTVLYTSGDELVPRLKALNASVTTTAWNGTGISLPNGNHTLLYNRFNPQTASDAELREYADGKILLATTTDYPEAVSYNIDIEWQVVFQRPDTVPDEAYNGGDIPDPGTGTNVTVQANFDSSAAGMTYDEYRTMMVGAGVNGFAIPSRLAPLTFSSTPTAGTFNLSPPITTEFMVTPSGDTTKFVTFVAREITVYTTGATSLKTSAADLATWPPYTRYGTAGRAGPANSATKFSTFFIPATPTISLNSYGIPITMPKLSKAYRWYAPDHLENQLRWIRRGSDRILSAQYSRQYADALQKSKIDAAVSSLSKLSIQPGLTATELEAINAVPSDSTEHSPGQSVGTLDVTEVGQPAGSPSATED